MNLLDYYLTQYNMELFPDEIKLLILSYLPMVNIIKLYKTLSPKMKTGLVLYIPILKPISSFNNIINTYKSTMINELFHYHIRDNIAYGHIDNNWKERALNHATLFQLRKMYKYTCLYYCLR